MLGLRTVLVLSLLCTSTLFAGGPTSRKGEISRIPLEQLRLTRFVVNLHHVLRLKPVLAEQRRLEKMKEWKWANPVPVALGPSGQMFLVGGYPLARALADDGDRKIAVIIAHDYSALSMVQLWEKLKSRRLSHLRDADGVVRTVEQFPKTLAEMKHGTTGFFEVNIADVRPTQFAVGFKEIALQVVKLKKKIAAGEGAQYRVHKSGAAFRGPGGQLMLYDGHHFARAQLDAGFDTMHVEVTHDFSELTWEECWAEAKRLGLCFLEDENGVVRTVEELPTSFAALKDDPYRSLAWLVREAGGYQDLKIAFQEFKWAAFFRTRVKFHGNDLEAWKKALAEAMEHARGEEAKNLPGFTGLAGSCVAIIERLAEVELALAS